MMEELDMAQLTDTQKRFFASTMAALDQAESREAVARIGASLKARWTTALKKDPTSQETKDLRKLVNHAKDRYHQMSDLGQQPLQQPELFS